MQNELYHTKSAVLFLIFNRPDVTSKVFEAIRTAKPARLYIAADGPRAERSNEAALCAETRRIATEIDWDCQLQTLFRNENLGCKNAVSSAIDWFFSKEEEGIILEDDCLPANDFFLFCDTLLEKYRTDTRVRHISGCNLQFGNIRGNASYYFANMTHVWGWASWRRAWKDYDKDLKRFQEEDVEKQLKKIFEDRIIVETWTEIFSMVKADKIDTWDYQLGFTNFFNNGLTAIPNANLITNIGFRDDATHTFSADNPNANIPLGSLSEITHPVYFLPEKDADFYTLNIDFNVEQRRAEELEEARAKARKERKLKYIIKRLFRRANKQEQDGNQ